ncbi:MAG: hypothetical protein M0P12_03165 [Paludibacteraceae bacterium]|nr:hypothetical protein [Paludibacteraceae bacterium]
MSKNGKKVGNVCLMEKLAKNFREEGNYKKEMKELDKEYDFQNRDIPEDLFPISRFKALKSFISGLFKKSSKPEVIVSFNGETFMLDFTSYIYEELTERCPKEEDVLEKELLKEMNTNCDPKEVDPNWDGCGSYPATKLEVVEKDFQVIPSTEISFGEIKVSSDMPYNQIDPVKLTGIPDLRSIPVVDGDADSTKKTESSVEVNGKFFVKPRE